jgi:hypothetical protein
LTGFGAEYVLLMSIDMAQNLINYPTIGVAAKILGTSRKRLHQLYKDGKTPAVKRDAKGQRRYPPDALIQAQKALKPARKVSRRNYKNIVLLTYLIGAAIALLVQPKIISFLGASISLLLINYFIELLDTHVFDESTHLKKNSVVIASVVIALLLGIATVNIAPKIGEYIRTVWLLVHQSPDSAHTSDLSFPIASLSTFDHTSISSDLETAAETSL